MLYAFANVWVESGEVYLSDTSVNTEKHYLTDSWNETSTNIYSYTKQLFLLKQKNQKLKVLLSVSGWSYSANFAKLLSTSARQKRFTSSAVQLVQDFGFDRLDID